MPEWPVIYLRHLREPAIRLAHGQSVGQSGKAKAYSAAAPKVDAMSLWKSSIDHSLADIVQASAFRRRRSVPEARRADGCMGNSPR